MGRLEVILARKQTDDHENDNDNEHDENENEDTDNTEKNHDKNNENNEKKRPAASAQIGAPVVCVRLLTDSHLIIMKNMKEKKEREFEVLMRVWELGREKHERLLRPRLGSSDCVGK